MKHLSKISLGYLLPYLAFTRAISFHSLEIANITLPNQTFNALIPSPPPGFLAKTQFNQTTPLDPTGVYLATISLMYGLSEQPWSSAVNLGRLAYVESPPVREVRKRVAIITMEEAPGLQPGHVILALYETVMAMYSRRPGFYNVVIKINLQGQYIGKVVMVAPFALPTVSGSQSRTLPGDDIVRGTDSVTADSGVFIDPDDGRFRISWDFNGRSVPAQETFSAVLDGMMTAALHDKNEPCAYITAVSFSGNIVLHISRVDGENLLWGEILRVFLIIPHWIITVERVFTEMDFTLEFDGRKIATGDIFKISSIGSQDSNSTERIAAS